MYLQKRQMLQMLKFYFYSKTNLLNVGVQSAEDIVEKNVQFLRLFHRKCWELKFSWILLLLFFFIKLFTHDKSLGFSKSSDTKHADIKYNVRYINNAWNNNVMLKGRNAQIIIMTHNIWMVKG